ncbi:hypothetical protein PR048_006448 [Dryococelus australis]|uniref:Uncharacterized protein n=1 Tax=Dryococelus australis TaxID=614101 RepID=A0ABQ9IB14_9NEOP|nr:hypothetical protein PR048_006448 [Dryococelus australis]
MVKDLRPGYEPPNRKQLAGPLLNPVYEQLNQEASLELSGQSVTLMQDRWSRPNLHNDPVIANVLSIGNKSYFISAIDAGTNAKASQYCLEQAKEAISEAHEKFIFKVKSFVSVKKAKIKPHEEKA